MSAKKIELKVYAMATGIKKRCRKVSREMITIGNFPLDCNREIMSGPFEVRNFANGRVNEWSPMNAAYNGARLFEIKESA